MGLKSIWLFAGKTGVSAGTRRVQTRASVTIRAVQKISRKGWLPLFGSQNPQRPYARHLGTAEMKIWSHLHGDMQRAVERHHRSLNQT